jgi:GDP-L-fucose synthase
VNERLYVAGGSTLLGRALLHQARASGRYHLVGLPGSEPDPTQPGQVDEFFAQVRPTQVIVAAGRSGGIGLNRDCPADLMLDNLLSITHLLRAAHEHKVQRLLYLGSSCMYPVTAPQPLCVESLLTGPLEPTSAAYATARLAGWQLCRAYQQQYGDCFLMAIPTNSFGPHDDFTPQGGHVIPALMRRLHEAKVRQARSVTIWGSGRPRREFLYAPDLADAALFVLQHHPGPEPINLGGGTDLSIAELAQAIADVVGYAGELHFDASQPDGAPRKCLEAGPLFALGWRPRTDFRVALDRTYRWFLERACREVRPHGSATV